jgi:hypothetical protein
MSTAVAPFPVPSRSLPQGLALAATMLGIATLAAVLAGWIPIYFSIATVFLFAGPHNWFEARYILGRLPARAGKLFGFFTLSFVGIIGLTLAFALIPLIWFWSAVDHPTAYAIEYRIHSLGGDADSDAGHTNPRFDAVDLAGAFDNGRHWLQPFAFSMASFICTLQAQVILDRELKKSGRTGPAYHLLLLLLPIMSPVSGFKLPPKATQLQRRA